MFPLARKIFESHAAVPRASPSYVSAQKICDLMRDAQHVELDFAIWDYAADLAVEHSLSQRGQDGGVYAPDGARLFANSLVVTIPVPPRDGRDGHTICRLFMRNGEIVLGYGLMPTHTPWPDGSTMMLFSGYRPGKQGFVKSELLNFGADLPTMIQEALQDAFMISVLSHDRFVKKSDTPSRQQRRSVERSAGFAPAGWYRVTWNIGDDVKAKVATSDPDNARPLHFCRAHWRHAAEGQPKAIQRNDAQGWWCWVRECWKGHPAFGVKLHHYTPKMKNLPA